MSADPEEEYILQMERQLGLDFHFKTPDMNKVFVSCTPFGDYWVNRETLIRLFPLEEYRLLIDRTIEMGQPYKCPISLVAFLTLLRIELGAYPNNESLFRIPYLEHVILETKNITVNDTVIARLKNYVLEKKLPQIAWLRGWKDLAQMTARFLSDERKSRT